MVVEQRLGCIGLATLCLVAFGCRRPTPTNNSPCPDPNNPLVCSTIGCCPVGYPYACDGHCYADASSCSSYVYCDGSGGGSAGSGGGGSGGGGPAGEPFSVNITVDYFHFTCPIAGQSLPYEWAPLYVALDSGSSFPAVGWSAGSIKVACDGDQAYCGGFSPTTTVLFPQTLTITGNAPRPSTMHAFAYWSQDGTSAGPGSADPSGQAAIDLVAGTEVYDVAIKLSRPCPGCTPCTNPSQCPSGLGCSYGFCSPCSVTAQCNEACINSVCTPCSTASDCGPFYSCNSGQCVACSATNHCCNTNPDCPSGYVCDQTSFFCYDPRNPSFPTGTAFNCY